MAALQQLAAINISLDDENALFDSDVQSLSLNDSQMTHGFEKLPHIEVAASTKTKAAIRSQTLN